jgi:hypothetical protein
MWRVHVGFSGATFWECSVSCRLASVLGCVNPAPGYESINAAQISAAHSERDDLSLSDAGPILTKTSRSRLQRRVTDPGHPKSQTQRIFEKRSSKSKSIASWLHSRRSRSYRKTWRSSTLAIPSFPLPRGSSSIHTVEFAFECETKKWAATVLTVHSLVLFKIPVTF